jgi:hypothetical protein
MGNESMISRNLHIAIALILTACFLFFVLKSLDWRWMSDSQIFHYAILLMERGMSPYRQIIDINWPGSYFSEYFGIFLFGSSDLAWRLYDYSILLALIAACVVIAYRYNWIAGLYAGIIFALIHGSEGPWQTAERDEVIAALVLGGYALTFVGVRYRKSIPFFLAAFLITLAGTIKPTALAFGLLLLPLALRQLKRLGVGVQSYLRESLIGFGIATAATLGFLLWRNSLVAFFELLSSARSYSALNHSSFYFMLHHSTPRGLFIILPFAAYLFFRNQSWKNWEVSAICGGMIIGYLSYWLQGKGFEYHRYPFVAFALLWSGLEFVIASSAAGFYRWFGVTGLAVGTSIVAPFYTFRVISAEQSNALPMALMADLQKFPLTEMQGRVQCLDGMVGCYSALYRLGLTSSTGFMGDQLLFSTHSSPAVLQQRAEFWREIMASPPLIFVETNYWYGERQSFDMIEAWPEFAAYLGSSYNLVTEWNAPTPLGWEPIGYRIYRRKPE